MSYKRVISLLPAATEIICALDSENCLVGISHECDFPDQISHLPKCTSTFIHSKLSSLEIDQMVAQQALAGLSLYQLDWELIKSLQPDLIITQDQCKVCAIHLDDLKAQIQLALGYPVAIISINPSTIEDIFLNIKEIAKALSKSELAETLLEDYQDRLDLIAHKVKHVKQKPSLVFIEWLDPLMTAGHWTPSLISLAGAHCLLSNPGLNSEKITWSDLQQADPDFILIAPCGFNLARIEQEIHLLQANPHWAALKAVRENRVFIADGNAFFNRPGPRIIDSAEIIAEILQVNQFYFGLEGSAWIGPISHLKV
jgi:iron complex transport system substrate-binding protein